MGKVNTCDRQRPAGEAYATAVRHVVTRRCRHPGTSKDRSYAPKRIPGTHQAGRERSVRMSRRRGVRQARDPTMPDVDCAKTAVEGSRGRKMGRRVLSAWREESKKRRKDGEADRRRQVATRSGRSAGHDCLSQEHGEVLIPGTRH